jgi:hypothetical protein
MKQIEKEIRRLKRESKINKEVEQFIEAGGTPYADPIVAELNTQLASIITKKIALENTTLTPEKMNEYLKLVFEEKFINLKIQKELSRVLKTYVAPTDKAIVGLSPDDEAEMDTGMAELIGIMGRIMTGGGRRRTAHRKRPRHRRSKTQRRH